MKLKKIWTYGVKPLEWNKTSTEVLRRSPQWAFNTHTHTHTQKQTHTDTHRQTEREREIDR